MLNRLLGRTQTAAHVDADQQLSAPDPPVIGDQATIRSLLVANAYRNVQPSLRATGHRSFPLRFRGLGEPTSQPNVAEEFLLACQVERCNRAARESVQSYFEDGGIQLIRRIDVEARNGAERRIDLPAPLRLDAPLGDALARRRSCRTFTPSELSLPQLATVIAAAAGTTGIAVATLRDGNEVELPLRAAPSAGGLYPISVYVIAQRVCGVAPAIYRYAPRYHQLVEHARAVHPADLAVAPGDAEHLDAATVVLLFVARPWRSMRKYGTRGLRYALVEAGAMAQGAHLAAVGLGLGSLDWGSSSDADIHAVLGVDGLRTSLVHAILLGSVS